jgi:hypothetical protein
MNDLRILYYKLITYKKKIIAALLKLYGRRAIFNRKLAVLTSLN